LLTIGTAIVLTEGNLPTDQPWFWGIAGTVGTLAIAANSYRMRTLGGPALQDELASLRADIEALRGEFVGRQITESIVDEEDLKKLEQNAKGIVVILFSDIESVTQYVEHHGDELAYERLKFHNQLVRNALKLHDGAEVKHLGDGFMANFASARDALLCAAEIQSQLQDVNHQNMPLQVRIGIHAGEPIQEDSDFVGRTVILAQRIMNQARGGQIFVSEVVKTLVGPLKGYQYVDQGLRRMEGITEAQRLFELHPIQALIAPTDSSVDRRLKTLEQRIHDKN